MAIAIIPIMNAFQPAIESSQIEEETKAFAHHARATLLRVAALDFETLETNQGNPVDLAALFGSAEEAAKESFSFQGQTRTPSVAITDAGGGAGDLLLLEAAVESVRLTMLKANY